jgi:hypothetical protein
VDEAGAAATAAALAADGYDSIDALRAGKLDAVVLKKFGVGAGDAAAIAAAVAALSVGEEEEAVPSGAAAGGAADADAAAEKVAKARGFSLAAVPLDELLLTALVKLAGGAKKGAVFASHMSFQELAGRVAERMTARFRALFTARTSC